MPAFWLWAQVLRQLFAPVRRGERARGRELRCPSSRPRATRTPEQSRFLLFDAVARALARASRRRPLAVVLEDLHWAGPPSLRLLEHLAFETAREALLVLATCATSRERGHPLERTLRVLRQQERARRSRCAASRAREVGALLARVLGRPAPRT